MARRRDTAEQEPHPSRVGEVLRRSENKTSISLAGMGLVRVPSALRHAVKLKSLDISGNRLSELPEWLNELPALAYIVARGNPMRSLPPDARRRWCSIPQMLWTCRRKRRSSACS